MFRQGLCLLTLRLQRYYRFINKMQIGIFILLCKKVVLIEKFCLLFLINNLSGWRNGTGNIEVFQPSVYDQRKGTRVRNPLVVY